MSDCPELRILLSELDRAGHMLDDAKDEQARAEVTLRINKLIRSVRIHRDMHSGCDFKPPIH